MEKGLEQILTKFHLHKRWFEPSPDDSDLDSHMVERSYSVVVIPPVGIRGITDWLLVDEQNVYKVETCITAISNKCIAEQTFVDFLQKEFGPDGAKYALRLCGILLFIKARMKLLAYTEPSRRLDFL